MSMTLFSGQPALSYDGTMHYNFDYAQQIHYPHYSQQVGPLCQCLLLYSIFYVFLVCVASGDLVLSSCHCPISVPFQYSML
jgi:hypothetical protein